MLFYFAYCQFSLQLNKLCVTFGYCSIKQIQLTTMIYRTKQAGLSILTLTILSVVGADQQFRDSGNFRRSIFGMTEVKFISNQKAYCSNTTLEKCKEPEFMDTDIWKLMCFNDTSVPPRTHLCSYVCSLKGRRHQLQCDDYCSGKQPCIFFILRKKI